MEQWVHNTLKEYKKIPGPNGLLLAFSRVCEKQTDIKLKIHEITGLTDIRDKSDLDPKDKNVVDLKFKKIQSESGEELAAFYDDLSVLRDAEKKIFDLFGKTTINPKTITGIMTIHGTIFNIEVFKKRITESLKKTLNEALKENLNNGV
jgi:hypothetical protein